MYTTNTNIQPDKSRVRLKIQLKSLRVDFPIARQEEVFPRIFPKNETRENFGENPIVSNYHRSLDDMRIALRIHDDFEQIKRR